VEVIDGLPMILGLSVAAWWIVARNHFPRALTVRSVVALGVAVVALLIKAVPWQLVPWQMLAVLGALAAIVKWWRPGISRQWTRMLGRVVLLPTNCCRSGRVPVRARDIAAAAGRPAPGRQPGLSLDLECVDDHRAGRVGCAKRSRDRKEDHRGLANSGKIDEARSVRERGMRRKRRCDGGCQTSFTHAAGGRGASGGALRNQAIDRERP
jgi:hypothetical protein